MAGPADDLTATGRLRLAALLDTDAPLNEAFARILVQPGEDAAATPPIQAVIPPEAVAGPELVDLLHSVQAEYEEIESALARLRERADLAAEVGHDAAALAFVSERELADPGMLERVLAPLQSQRMRFEVLFTQAKRALERLDPYALSRLPADELVRQLRGASERGVGAAAHAPSAAVLATLEYAVDFLRSLQRAADSFEALELPRWDIRQYLEHLYLTENWAEMERLVRQLEKAVLDYLRREGIRAGGADSGPAPP